MSNEHFDKAKSRLHNGTTNEVARAQAEATIALAYEQRTANLLALWAHPALTVRNSHTGNTVTWSLQESEVGALLESITKRLGLNQEATK